MSVGCSRRAGQFDGSVPASARSVTVNHDSGSACIGILRIILLKYAGEIYPPESWYVASLVHIYPFLLIMPGEKRQKHGVQGFARQKCDAIICPCAEPIPVEIDHKFCYSRQISNAYTKC